MASRRINNNKNNTQGKARAPKARVPAMVGVARRMTRVATGQQGTPFKGKERLAAVQSSAGPDGGITQFYWNPGMAATFSLGHQIARSYEKYSVRNGGNSVTYITSSPTTTAGRIYMYANYDPSDQVPTTEDEFADRTDAVSSCLWENLTLQLKGGEMTPGGPKPVRVGNSAQDKNITDGCTIVVGVFGNAGAATVGNVFIHYNADLHVQRPQALERQQPKDSTFIGFPLNRELTNGSLFSNTELTILGDGLGVEVDEIGINEGLVMPPGAYVVSAQAGVKYDAHDGRTLTSINLTINGADAQATISTVAFNPLTEETIAMLHTNHNYLVVGDSRTVLNLRVNFADVAANPELLGNRTRIYIKAA